MKRRQCFLIQFWVQFSLLIPLAPEQNLPGSGLKEAEEGAVSFQSFHWSLQGRLRCFIIFLPLHPCSYTPSAWEALFLPSYWPNSCQFFKTVSPAGRPPPSDFLQHTLTQLFSSPLTSRTKTRSYTCPVFLLCWQRDAPSAHVFILQGLIGTPPYGGLKKVGKPIFWDQLGYREARGWTK